MATTVALLTLEEFLSLPETASRQELDEGVLLEMPPAKQLHSEVLHRILFALYEAAKVYPQVRVRAELACQLSVDPPIVRVADVAALSADQLTQTDENGYVHGAPTLAVEVVSPSESAASLVRKTRQYLEAGASAVFAVYPELREIHVYRQDASIQALQAKDSITLPELLPGWSCAVSDLLP